MGKKNTIEEFIKDVYNLYGEEYSVIGKEYINNRTHIMMRHNTCGTEYPVTPYKILKAGKRCPACFGTPKKTTEKFKKEVFEKTNGQYEVLGEYITARIPILIKHLKCGNTWSVIPDSFLRRKNIDICLNCPQVQKIKTVNIKRPKIQKVKIVNIKIRKNKTYIFPVDVDHWRIKYAPIFTERVESLVGDEYTILGEYINANTPILMRHNKCGTEYPVTPNKFTHNRRCPKCNNPKGEKRCEEVFIYNNFIEISEFDYNNLLDKQNNKYYIPQKKFDGLVGLRNGLLSYDFFLPQYNLLIEYQGGQHEKFCKGFHKTIKDFERQVEHDRRKREYAKKNNIKLLEIWYYDFDKIEEILDGCLKELSLLDSSFHIKEGGKI